MCMTSKPHSTKSPPIVKSLDGGINTRVDRLFTLVGELERRVAHLEREHHSTDPYPIKTSMTPGPLETHSKLSTIREGVAEP